MDCDHNHKHDHKKLSDARPAGPRPPHGPHGPHGGPHHGKKDLIKSLDKDSLEALLIKTTHKLLHSSKEDLQSGAAFATLTPQEKQQLKDILDKVAANIKAEKHEKPAAPEQSAD